MAGGLRKTKRTLAQMSHVWHHFWLIDHWGRWELDDANEYEPADGCWMAETLELSQPGYKCTGDTGQAMDTVG